MPMIFSDTHCHLDFNHFDRDRDAVLQRARQVGIDRILVPGVDLQSSQAAVDLAESNTMVYAAVGVHPNSTSGWREQDLVSLERLAAHPKVVAIGEIGLDYYRHRSPEAHQKRAFSAQLALASQLDLPVLVHTRNKNPSDHACISDVISILSEPERGQCFRGVIHSYSGDCVEAQTLMNLGFYIGITGPVTFKNATLLHQIVAEVPLEQLLIETDSPFLTPHPHRGQRNEPAYVQLVAEKISDLRSLPLAEVARQTSENAEELLGWR